jgi:hypothetical protein
MTALPNTAWRGTALAIAVLVTAGLPVDLGVITTPAQAIVGRPATPVSVAGVARRTTRRTVAVAAATTPVYVAPVYAAPPPPQNCVTTYNSYGQSVTTCN